ncbi:hypothetical protein OK074_1544 [Actinobacteria bacterium OK074]|nr:hypothetical protein OK074_1544 [Actinobacteria bacterium OK074]
MSNHDETVAVRPLTLAWVCRYLEVGERIVGTEVLHGGSTAEMRRLPGWSLSIRPPRSARIRRS